MMHLRVTQQCLFRVVRSDPAVTQAAAAAGVSLVPVGRADFPPEASVVDAGPGALFYDCLAQVALLTGQDFNGVLMIHDGEWLSDPWRATA